MCPLARHSCPGVVTSTLNSLSSSIATPRNAQPEKKKSNFFFQLRYERWTMTSVRRRENYHNGSVDSRSCQE